jgi:hypothetical protein
MTRPLTPSTTTRLFLGRISQPSVPLLTVLYLVTLLGLAVLYGPGDFSTPSFIYQGF